MKKLLISVVIILLLLAGLYFIFNDKSEYQMGDSGFKEGEEEITLLVNPALSENKTYKEPTTYAIFDVVYPQFENVSAEFNKKIEDLVVEAIRIHTEDSEANWKARSDDAPAEKFQFYTAWTPVQVNKNYVSFLMRLGGYVGGAHGYENLASFNYDVTAKKEIALSDLFSKDPNYLKTISEFVRRDLRRQLGNNTNEDMLFFGTEPNTDNFSVFTLLPDSATFYFQEYQVAPYAMGESKVIMPRK